MAFGMSPFPLRFGSRQGGIAAAPPLTPDNVTQILSDVGLIFTRAGPAPSGPSSDGYLSTVTEDEPALEWVPDYGTYALLVRPAVTNLCIHPRDLSEWSGTDATALRDEVGIDGAVDGASSVLFTANDGYVALAITSGEALRATVVWMRRITGTGQISISQDGGSTWTVATLTAGYKRFVIPVATIENPTLQIKGAAQDDKIAVDFVGHHLAVGSEQYSHRPAAPAGTGATASHAAEQCALTLSAFPATVDISMIFRVGRVATNSALFRIHEPGDYNGSLFVSAYGGNLNVGVLQNSDLGFAASNINLGAIDDEEMARVDVQYTTSGLFRARRGSGEWQSSTWLNADLGRVVKVGGGWTTGHESNSAIVAIRDNAHSILSPPYGWGHAAFL